MMCFNMPDLTKIQKDVIRTALSVYQGRPITIPKLLDVLKQYERVGLNNIAIRPHIVTEWLDILDFIERDQSDICDKVRRVVLNT